LNNHLAHIKVTVFIRLGVWGGQQLHVSAQFGTYGHSYMLPNWHHLSLMMKYQLTDT